MQKKTHAKKAHLLACTHAQRWSSPQQENCKIKPYQPTCDMSVNNNNNTSTEHRSNQLRLKSKKKQCCAEQQQLIKQQTRQETTRKRRVTATQTIVGSQTVDNNYGGKCYNNCWSTNEQGKKGQASEELRFDNKNKMITRQKNRSSMTTATGQIQTAENNYGWKTTTQRTKTWFWSKTTTAERRTHKARKGKQENSYGQTNNTNKTQTSTNLMVSVPVTL